MPLSWAIVVAIRQARETTAQRTGKPLFPQGRCRVSPFFHGTSTNLSTASVDSAPLEGDIPNREAIWGITPLKIPARRVFSSARMPPGRERRGFWSGSPPRSAPLPKAEAKRWRPGWPCQVTVSPGESHRLIHRLCGQRARLPGLSSVPDRQPPNLSARCGNPPGSSPDGIAPGGRGGKAAGRGGDAGSHRRAIKASSSFNGVNNEPPLIPLAPDLERMGQAGLARATGGRRAGYGRYPDCIAWS